MHPQSYQAAVTMPLASGGSHAITQSDLDRFWAKVDKTASCWLWTGKVNAYGYGDFGLKKRLVKAHRFSYTVSIGVIPEGLTVDHLCSVRHCVNPDHLEAVTQRENTLRSSSIAAQRARLTHCPQGHPYDEVNTYLTKKNERMCRACHRDRERARKAEIRRAKGAMK